MSRFQPVDPISMEEAAAAFETGNSHATCDALVRLAFHHPDWRAVQDLCLRFETASDSVVRRAAITCLGHLARIHHQIDQERVVPLLQRLLADSKVAGEAEDALEDVRQYAD